MKVRVVEEKKKTVTIKPEELVTSTLLDIIEEKTKLKVGQADVLSFDGKKAVINAGETVVLEIDDEELLYKSAEKIIQERLKKRSKLNLELVKIKARNRPPKK